MLIKIGALLFAFLIALIPDGINQVAAIIIVAGVIYDWAKK